MYIYDGLLLALLPWLTFVLFAVIAISLIRLAKKRRHWAWAFGVFVQMFLPDPHVERTIETVVVEKRKEERREDSGEKDRE